MGTLEKRQGPTPLVNRILVRLLRSPLSRLVDGGLILLTVTGRRTGRTFTFPVQYVEDGRVLWVYAGGSDAKTWWRNLVGGADVEVLLRRRVYPATAIAVVPTEARELVEEGLRRYVERFPATSRRLGIATGNRLAFEQAAASVIVRIELHNIPDLPARPRTGRRARWAVQREA
jgi:deazaflavin-dependent oxidoreductase (nitroreductase family)